MNEARALRTHRLLVRIAFSGTLFVWVAGFAHLSWVTGDIRAGLIGTVLAYACAHLVIFFFMPLCAQHVRDGVRRTLALGALLLSLMLAYAGVVFSTLHTINMTLVVMFVCAFVWGLYRALYAISYRAHTQLSASQGILREVMLALMPFMFAIVAVLGGFAWVCGIASLCALMSLIPLSHLREEYEPYRWSGIETIMQVFVAHNRTVIVDAMARGVERMVLFLLWPLMILMFSTSLVMFGALLSLTLFLTLLFRAYMPRLFAWVGVHRSPVVASVSVASLWIVRGLVASPFGIMIAHVSGALLPHTYAHESEGRIYLDEYSALNEMGSALGVLLGCVIVVLLTLTVSLPAVLLWSCVCAGAASAYAVWAGRIADPRF